MKLNDMFNRHSYRDCQVVLDIYPYEVELQNGIAQDVLDLIFEGAGYTKRVYRIKDKAKESKHYDWVDAEGDWTIEFDGQAVRMKYYNAETITEFEFTGLRIMRRFEHYIW